LLDAQLNTVPSEGGSPLDFEFGGERNAAGTEGLREGFLNWWHTALECLFANLKFFRRFDDDDITALYLATWLGAFEDLVRRDEAPAGKSIDGFLSGIDGSRLSGLNVSELAGLTCLPRETARRKLFKASKLRIIERHGESGFRLFNPSSDIGSLFGQCTALASVSLNTLNRTRVREGADLEVGEWIALMQQYLSWTLAFWSERRSITRGSSAVSVLLAMEILTILKIYRRLAETGQLPRGNLPRALEMAPASLATPYFIAQIAALSRLDVAKVRRMCRKLADREVVKFVGNDAIKPLKSYSVFPGRRSNGAFSERLLGAGFHFVEAATTLLVTPPVFRLQDRPLSVVRRSASSLQSR
jgi:hypothetical protein